MSVNSLQTLCITCVSFDFMDNYRLKNLIKIYMKIKLKHAINDTKKILKKRNIN